MRLTSTTFEERGVAERLKLYELIALLSNPVSYTILILHDRKINEKNPTKS